MLTSVVVRSASPSLEVFVQGLFWMHILLLPLIPLWFLGAGLLVGYRFGVLSRPIGYGGYGYNYRYIHGHREYDMDRPLTCTATNVTEFLKTMDSTQELNIDEGEIKCSLEEDVCFGKISVLEANITMADGSGTREGFEVRLGVPWMMLKELNMPYKCS